MNYTEQYREHIECTFHAFCKTVLYHAAINACRDLQRKQQHEVSLDYRLKSQLMEAITACALCHYGKNVTR